MDIAKDRSSALSLGYTLYYGNECHHCKTTIKRVRQYDCLECNRKKTRDHYKTPRGRALKRTANRLRKADQRKARVSWACMETITDFYREAKYLGWHIDHIIPLKHPRVCGLHVENNLQALSPEENMRKGNRWCPEDEPEEVKIFF